MPHLPHSNPPAAWDFQDVWFVDDDTDAGNYSYGFTDPSGWGKIESHANHVSYGIYTNAQGEFKMNLGFGGIQPKAWGKWASLGDGGASRNNAEMYDLLNSSLYSAENSFIKGIEGNTKFRWREDPTETIYTIENTQGFFKIRYEDMAKGTGIYHGGDHNPHTDLVWQWLHGFGYVDSLNWWWNEYYNYGYR